MFAAALAKVCAVWRIAASRSWLRYPLFACMAVFGAARVIALLAADPRKSHPYTEIFVGTLAITFALEAGACIEAFWILAFHFRNIKVFGSVVFLFFAAMGGTLSYILVAIWSGWWTSPFTQAAILAQRLGLTMIAVALLSLLLFRQFPWVPVKPNAIRHLAILAFLFGSVFASGFFVQSDRKSFFFLANLSANVGNVVAFGLWAWLMRPEGERLPFEPAPLMRADEIAAGDAGDRLAMDQAVQRGKSSWEDLKRQS